MAYTVDGESLTWRIDFDIDNIKIDSNLTDKDLLIDLADMPSDFWENVKADGGDIRGTLSDGTTRVPVEVKNFVDGGSSGTGQLFMKVSSMSSSVDTTVYVYWGNAALSQPAIDSTYGSENVWSAKHINVQHNDQDPSGSAPQMIDSTSNDNDGTTSGSMTSGDLIAATVGSGLDLDGTDDYVTYGTTGFDVTVGAIEMLVKLNYAYTDAGIPPLCEMYTGNSDRLLAYYNGASDSFLFLTNDQDAGDVASSTQSFSSGTVIHFAFQWDAGEATNDKKLFINGALDSVGPAPLDTFTKAATMTAGLLTFDSAVFDTAPIVLDEVRVYDAANTAAWYNANFENWVNTSAFYTVGTAVESGAGPSAAVNAIFFGANF